MTYAYKRCCASRVDITDSSVCPSWTQSGVHTCKEHQLANWKLESECFTDLFYSYVRQLQDPGEREGA